VLATYSSSYHISLLISASTSSTSSSFAFHLLYLLCVCASIYIQYAQTALMVASEIGDTPTVKLLLDAGANTKAKNEVREIV
jgi:ankyrin repeat protein